jgi:hypothetical protein
MAIIKSIYLKINNIENSECSVMLNTLDFNNWFQDTSKGMNYLHVQVKGSDEYFRVFCKKNENPRIAMENGRLYWIIDKK